MKRPIVILALAIVTAAGCGTSFQSSQVMAPGKTQFVGALSRTTPDDDFTPDEGGVFHGDLQVRHGLHQIAELGVRYTGATAGHFLQVDGKFQVVPKLFSVALPVGVYFVEMGLEGDGRELDYGGLMITPTLFVGGEVVPNQVELVGAPKFMIVFPDDADSDGEFGASLCARLSTDLAKWALVPEIAYMAYGGEENLLTFGLGVAANY